MNKKGDFSIALLIAVLVAAIAWLALDFTTMIAEEKTKVNGALTAEMLGHHVEVSRVLRQDRIGIYIVEVDGVYYMVTSDWDGGTAIEKLEVP